MAGLPENYIDPKMEGDSEVRNHHVQVIHQPFCFQGLSFTQSTKWTWQGFNRYDLKTFSCLIKKKYPPWN